MAATKIHEITATVGKAVKYICNPDKTDEKLLVFGYGCEDYSAELEFELTRQQQCCSSKTLARHIIQSFSPGEVTSEQAHAIGKQLADELLRGEYEYILATHVNCGHIHNHIIVNEVNFVTGKTFSTEHDRKKNPAWKQIRTISDKLCMENDLSVIQNSELGHGKSYYEWEQSQAKRSWKDKLKDVIDDCIMEADCFEDFLKKMQEHNYEYKLRGDTLSFRAEGQERFTRCRKQTLGWYYEPEQLRGRIERSLRRRNAPIQKRDGFVQVQNPNENNIGLQRWAMLKNMQELSEMVNVLTELGCRSPDEIKNRLYSAHGERSACVHKLRDIHSEIAEKEFKLKHIRNYWKTKPINDQYKKSFNKKGFYKKHEKELLLYKSSKAELKKIIPGDTLPNVLTLERELESLKKQKMELTEKYNAALSDVEKLEKAYTQYQTYISIEIEAKSKAKSGELE